MKIRSKYSKAFCLFLGLMIAIVAYAVPVYVNKSIDLSIKSEQKATSQDEKSDAVAFIQFQPAITTISHINLIQELQVILNIELPNKEQFALFDSEIRIDQLFKTLFRRIISINAP